MNVETTIIAGLAAAFVISAVDYFKYIPFWRGIIALLVATGAAAVLAVAGWTAPIYGAAGAFLALSAISLIEWAVTPKVIREARHR